MDKRIQKLAELTLSGQMYVNPVKTDYDRMDLLLPEHEKDVKRICEFILNQQPKITKYSALTGFFNFDASVIGNIFHRGGHPYTDKVLHEFYCKKVDNLSSMDWQHGTADYRTVLSGGMTGVMKEIEKSIESHTEPDRILFLQDLKKIAETFILWIKKCSGLVEEFSKTVEEKEYRENLKKLSGALLNIANGAPKTFYEAVLAIYVCFSLIPDSLGTLDRYLSSFYFRDIEKGILTETEAKVYIQELLLMVQAVTPIESYGFSRGGQSHFCIGGRDIDKKDCYNEVSKLIVDSLMELPTDIPEVTLRWTNDTPTEVLKYVLQCERNDKHKRIAFTNDDKRIQAYTKVCGLPYSEAINYTLVGCNEPALLGGMCASTSHANLAHSVETVLHDRSAEIVHAKTFEEFYAVFKDQLYKDLDRIYHLDDLYNLGRSRDINYVSCLLMNSSIKNGKSTTQGGADYAISTIMFLGNVTVIDSLAIIKQFVFDEKRIKMQELLDALCANWDGFEALRFEILKKGDFFGNDCEISNYVAKLFYDTLYKYIKDKKTVFGYPVLLGDHTGYQFHFKWFGEDTKATPDGRYAGTPLSYGIFQIGGKDRNGLSALMNSISKFDPHGISSATVTNFNLDYAYLENDEVFEKTALMLETFLKKGGMQFQLNYVTKEELLNAKAVPDEYKHLKVRVTGYSDYFTKLNACIQDSIIQRYER
ncbi:MAG: hypothetical protein IJE10_03855 [Clostridia bacterium]|nr:hypothetical protein [Clostridia bacterium]